MPTHNNTRTSNVPIFSPEGVVLLKIIENMFVL